MGICSRFLVDATALILALEARGAQKWDHKESIFLEPVLVVVNPVSRDGGSGSKGGVVSLTIVPGGVQ